MEEQQQQQFIEQQPDENLQTNFVGGGNTQGDEQKDAEKQGAITGEDQQEGEEFPDEACLFIGDLARGLTEEQLKEPFEAYGAASVEIKRDRTTGYSLGYGFAQFRTRKQAAEAKKALYKAVIGGRAIRLGWAQKNTNLFVGDLDPSVTTEMLREAFAKFGPIYKEETFVKHRNYGFVRYKHRKHAEVAKREMDGHVLGNRAIRIGWGDANYQRHCVHIQFDPAESEALTESDVINKFEEFGTVVSVNLPRTQGSLRGFGFIYYEDTDEGEDSASQVISSLNGTRISGVLIQCNFGKKPSSKKPARGQAGRGTDVAAASGMGMGVQRRLGGRGGQQQGLFPVQVMMPVGPQGTWQPVQYMMTAHQAQQFYSSVQFNPHPQQVPTSAREGNQSMMPMWYTYRSAKDKDDGSLDEEDLSESLPPQASPMIGGGQTVGGQFLQPALHQMQQPPQQQMRQGQYPPRTQQAPAYYNNNNNNNSYSAQRGQNKQGQMRPQQQQPQQPYPQLSQQQPPQQGRKAYLPYPKAGEQDYTHSAYEQG